MSQFEEYEILASLLKTLKSKGFSKATEIQKLTIPPLLHGKSVVGIAETGSGKTLSFALPILHLLKSLENSGDSVEKASSPRAIILVPTRELGEQISKVFKEFTHETRLRVRNALGSSKLSVAKKNISGNFEIMLATPGRLKQLSEESSLDFSDTRLLVIDEADQMLDQGFLSSIQFILDACKDSVQTALFTATAPQAVQDFIAKSFRNAEFFQSKNSHQISRNLETFHHDIANGKRVPVLKKILNNKSFEGSTLIFANTREQCDIIQDELRNMNIESGVYRGEMDKNERKQNLQDFRKGSLSILVATDLASRGLDVEHITRVINYHLPQDVENYLHRVGRTARAGKTGCVHNLVTERDKALMKKIESKKLC